MQKIYKAKALKSFKDAYGLEVKIGEIFTVRNYDNIWYHVAGFKVYQPISQDYFEIIEQFS